MIQSLDTGLQKEVLPVSMLVMIMKHGVSNSDFQDTAATPLRIRMSLDSSMAVPPTMNQLGTGATGRTVLGLIQV